MSEFAVAASARSPRVLTCPHCAGDVPVPREPTQCVNPHCGRTVGPGERLTRGMCGTCYAYWHLHRQMRPPLEYRARVERCRECGHRPKRTTPNEHLRRGLCHRCYLRAYMRQQRARKDHHATDSRASH